MDMELARAQTFKINADVKRQYEAYPYPDYSLFIPLRAQEAYASHSLFAGQLLKEKGMVPAIRSKKDSRMLIAGSGDVLPYVLSFWEPTSHRISSIDISRRNIERARFRSTFRPQTMDWLVGNLEDPQYPLPQNVSHIDSYGVLHHLANPSAAMTRLSSLLEDGGTMRIMVYNSAVRHWIHKLQKAFKTMGLDPFERRDLDLALGLLKTLMKVSPSFEERLRPMQSSIFHHSARFVDTFFHAHEGQVSLGEWLEFIEESGLETLGLYDRYAELDDLPNPLLTFPNKTALESRIEDRRFENNLEFYLYKKPVPGAEDHKQVLPSKWRMKMPPQIWFQYSETNSLPFKTRFQLWWAYLAHIEGKKTKALDAMASTLETKTLQRLARLGVIFPSQFQSKEIQDLLMRPMHESMEKPDVLSVSDLENSHELKTQLHSIFTQKQKHPSEINAIVRLFSEAQKS